MEVDSPRSSSSVSSRVSDQSATSVEIANVVERLIDRGEVDGAIINRVIKDNLLFNSILDKKFQELKLSKEERSCVLKIFKSSREEDCDKYKADPEQDPNIARECFDKWQKLVVTNREKNGPTPSSPSVP
ncbi:hypothetical protein N9X24_01890 [Rickettsiales bacterium]|nr:hypothetical protein [Rickettsiales bacterium]